jgi:ABC-2 type transport system permease protein
MSFARLLDKVVVVLQRELLNTLRMRFGLLFEVLLMLAEVAGFYFLARAIGPQFQPDGVDYFRFVLIGTALMGLLVTGTSGFVGSIHAAQASGTLEYLMITATPSPVVIALFGMATFVERAIRIALLFVLAAMLFGFRLPQANIAAFCVIYTLSVIVAVAVGLLAAAAQIAIQRGSMVVWVAGAAVGVLSGAVFPVSALPGWLQRVSALIPVTQSLNGIRAALLRGTPLSALHSQVMILAAWCLLLPLSILVLQATLRRARHAGSLGLF